MNPSDPQTNQPAAPSTNPLQTMRHGEEVLFEIKRHPIGMLGVFSLIGFLIIALAIILFGVVPGNLGSSGGESIGLISVAVFMLVTVLCLIFAFIANKVYWGNSWILTNDSITQITQTGLFHKHSSQLALESLEDVTAEQNGIFTHIFNYGVLKAETAGEHSKFIFIYCPDPNTYAQKILAAHENLEEFNRQVEKNQQQEHTVQQQTVAPVTNPEPPRQ